LRNGNIGIVTNDPLNPVIDTGVKEAGKAQIINQPGLGVFKYDPVTDTVRELSDEEKVQAGIAGRAGAEVTGGAVARAKYELPVELNKKQIELNQIDDNLEDVSTAIDAVRPGTAGWDQALKGILPASDARKLRNAAQTVISRLTINELSSLKATGATMGALNEQEFLALQTATQAVDPKSDPVELIRQLQAVEFHYGRVKERIISAARALQEQAQEPQDFGRASDAQSIIDNLK
jgi:hypothetical protein